MIHDIGSKVTVIVSIIDIQRLHDDPRVIVDRVEIEGGNIHYWVRIPDNETILGPYSKLEILDGWANVKA